MAHIRDYFSAGCIGESRVILNSNITLLSPMHPAKKELESGPLALCKHPLIEHEKEIKQLQFWAVYESY